MYPYNYGCKENKITNFVLILTRNEIRTWRSPTHLLSYLSIYVVFFIYIVYPYNVCIFFQVEILLLLNNSIRRAVLMSFVHTFNKFYFLELQQFISKIVKFSMKTFIILYIIHYYYPLLSIFVKIRQLYI